MFGIAGPPPVICDVRTMSATFKRVLWSASFLAALVPWVLLSLPRGVLTFEQLERAWIVVGVLGSLCALAASEAWRRGEFRGFSFWGLALNVAFLLVLGLLYAISIAHLD
jgi:hypothetical protein